MLTLMALLFFWLWLIGYDGGMHMRYEEHAMEFKFFSVFFFVCVIDMDFEEISIFL